MRVTTAEIGWARRGACRTSDPELFFPLSPSPEQEASAKAVCARCQVMDECRAYALRAGEAEGIWGGLTPQERRRSRFPANWRGSAAS
ncbi:WhiB family transcriptional regulator [Spongiactinospora sp. TRM90649]|uniref:WhiB family transcriptional regulator n=1 Tax=Spongiactinospora sp. TRM90649 TaxID=3031114 RepID=UPI0023F61DA1|nr:WhiB family transcriptional regulator [Spongiactinospora sp. TRM90649]MDF5751340.1 WhiB family transcriptional regulator [Spongiactinospora sp. TRM90649]